MVSVKMDSGELDEMAGSIRYLAKYDAEYISRMKAGRKEGKSPQVVEFERAQVLKAAGLKAEWADLRKATMTMSRGSAEIVLGIMSMSGSQGIDILRAWVEKLSLPRGVLTAMDSNNEDIPYEALQDGAVFIKYNSSDAGNAYMKPHIGNMTGVIFQPKLHPLDADQNDEFLQFGDLPTGLYR